MIRVVFFVFLSGAALTYSSQPYHVPLGSSVWGYFTPPVVKRPQQLQTPLEAMVDLTNGLGIAILQDHSYSRGNFAFSPYGVASVLVVMYEGAQGESANQIHRAVGFPANKDVLRMGFRDIHRHLRSYFSHEGFLSGITLNKNGSNLKPEYKKILRFYGYDVDLNVQSFDEPTVDHESKPSTQKTEPTKAAVTTTSPPNTEEPSMTTEVTNEEVDVKSTTEGNPREPTDIETETTQNGKDIITTTLMTTVREVLPTTEEVTTEDDSQLGTSTVVSLKEEDMSSTTENLSTFDGTTGQTTVTTEPTTESNADESATEAEQMDKRTDFARVKSDHEEMKQLTVVFPEELAMNRPEILEPDDNKENKFRKNTENDEKEVKCRREAGENEGGRGNEIVCEEKKTEPEEKTTEPETKGFEGETEFDVIKLDNGMLIPQPSEAPVTTKEGSGETALEETTEDIDPNAWPGEELSLEESSNRKSLRATKKMRPKPTLKPDNEGWEKNLRKMFNSKASIWLHEPRKKRKKPYMERFRRTIADYLKWPLNPDLSLQLQNGMYDTHVSRNAEMYRSLPRLMFLVDGAIDTPVPMMTYTNIFPYGYIAKLHAKALEFPLDDVRYKLLIVLPVERRGLRQLIYDLSDFSVRDVLKCLQPTRVKAVIPTFMVEGFVILTSSLQKLGIWDVFDPRKANLSGMSVDPELYVRNIEQSVTVVIRNYVEILDIQTRTMAARYLEHEFQATHPFVYFVLDTATNIALMAGQMLDPLNSRIY